MEICSQCKKHDKERKRKISFARRNNRNPLDSKPLFFLLTYIHFVLNNICTRTDIRHGCAWCLATSDPLRLLSKLFVNVHILMPTNAPTYLDFLVISPTPYYSVKSPSKLLAVQ